jgi:hypothetical protein
MCLSFFFVRVQPNQASEPISALHDCTFTNAYSLFTVSNRVFNYANSLFTSANIVFNRANSGCTFLNLIAAYRVKLMELFNGIWLHAFRFSWRITSK